MDDQRRGDEMQPEAVVGRSVLRSGSLKSKAMAAAKVIRPKTRMIGSQIVSMPAPIEERQATEGGDHRRKGDEGEGERQAEYRIEASRGGEHRQAGEERNATAGVLEPSARQVAPSVAAGKERRPGAGEGGEADGERDARQDEAAATGEAERQQEGDCRPRHRRR